MYHKDPAIVRVRVMHANIELDLGNMGYTISAMPSGDARNLLTEANIHLMAAKSKLDEADVLMCKQFLEKKESETQHIKEDSDVRLESTDGE